MRRRAGVDDRRAGGRDAHVRRLPERRLEAHALRAHRPRRRQAAHLHPGGEAHPAVHALAAQALLLGTELVDVEVLEQPVERALVVAGVVEDPERRLERELIARDEVLPPQLEPVHAELVGEPVHHQLDPVGGLRAARAADRVGGHLVREHAREVQVDVRDPVAAAHHREAQLRDERREQLLVGAEVGDDLHPERRDRPVALRPQRHVVDLVAAVVARRHVLRARLDPLHRPAEPLREREDEHLLAVGLELRAEAAAHVGRDHAQLVLRDAEHAGEDEPRDVRDLGGRVERELVAADLADRAARLDRGARGAVVHEPVLDRDLRLGEAGVDVAAADAPLVRPVGAELLPDERRAVLERRLGIHDRGLRVVVDDHVLGGVDGERAGSWPPPRRPGRPRASPGRASAASARAS